MIVLKVQVGVDEEIMLNTRTHVSASDLVKNVVEPALEHNAGGTLGTQEALVRK